MAAPLLDLYLAHAFISYPSVWEQLAARGADPHDTGATWRSLTKRWSADQTFQDYTALFGPPSESRDYGSRLWSLTLWPDHVWRGFEANGQFFASGMELRVPRLPTRVAELRLGYDTKDEIRSALGPTDESWHGWSPEDEFLYDLPDGSVLRCVTVYGLLVSIEQSNAARSPQL